MMLLFSSLNMLAYTPENHSLITQAAIDYLNDKYAYDFISKEEAEKIIKGNVSEDRLWYKWFVRLFNHHFYNPFKPLKLRTSFRSIQVRFDRISKRAFRKIQSKKYFYRVGELLHHVQDLSNPAHSVPVYHFKNPTDQFDGQDLIKTFKFESEIDTNTRYTSPYHASILKPVAQQTLQNIQDKFEIKVQIAGAQSTKIIDWTYFWKENPNRWFGCYGYLGAPYKGEKSDNYLQDTIQKGDTLYHIDSTIYRAFSKKQYDLAVKKTAEFIYYAKMRYNQTKSISR